MFAPEPDTFTPAPEGSHIAVLIRFIDLGSAASPFDNIIRRRIRLGYETAHEFMPDGRPFIVSKTVNLSLRQGSNRRSIVEALLGRKLTKADVSESSPDRLRVDALVGLACRVTVVHREDKTGTTWANADSFAQLLPRERKEVPAAINPPLIFDLEAFDQDAFDSLPEKTRDAIAVTPEYKARHAKPANAKEAFKARAVTAMNGPSREPDFDDGLPEDWGEPVYG